MIDFAANVLGRPLDPWQQWLVIHLGELLEDGRPRFRRVLVIVARQNGKTWLCTVLALFWVYVERHKLVFGTSNKIEYAVDSWAAAVTIAQTTPALKARTLKPRYTNGQNDLPTRDGAHYRIAAANADGGRSKSIDRAIGDELRQQTTWEAYAAIVPAMNARPNAQIVWITNMGDATSVVLNELRSQALDDIRSSVEDISDTASRLGLFEWSALEGSHPADAAALAAANPQFGRRMDADDLLEQARAVARPGVDPKALAKHLTEVLCLTVDNAEPAIAPAAWSACSARAPMPAGVRLAACVDVAPDGQHVTLAVAGLDDDRWRIEVVTAWDGPDALEQLRRQLRGWVQDVRPSFLGWFPGSAAAAVDADLRDRRKQGRYLWPPRGVQIVEIRPGHEPAVCMGFTQQVSAGAVAHPDDPLLNAHAAAAGKIWLGDKWVFGRQGSGHVDAVYAAAGALHLIRTAPKIRRGTGTIAVG